MDGYPLVLIVEDDLSTRVMYRDYLNQSGFRTADAHNGFQALEKARLLMPDAIVTDLAVPGMDGFEFCRALQESVTTRAIPIIAVTGHSEYLEQPDRFRDAGILRVLVKPCEPDVIVQELRHLLNGNGKGGAMVVSGFKPESVASGAVWCALWVVPSGAARLAHRSPSLLRRSIAGNERWAPQPRVRGRRLFSRDRQADLDRPVWVGAPWKPPIVLKDERNDRNYRSAARRVYRPSKIRDAWTFRVRG